MLGQTWQEAGAREVLEETGVLVALESLWFLTVATTPDRRQNLLFCQSPPVEHEGSFTHDAEVPKCWSSTSQLRLPFRCIQEWWKHTFSKCCEHPANARVLLL
jgi:8-oxo-dGTP pyrophosphatase MutT (NUDIX family)